MACMLTLPIVHTGALPVPEVTNSVCYQDLLSLHYLYYSLHGKDTYPCLIQAKLGKIDKHYLHTLKSISQN